GGGCKVANYVLPLGDNVRALSAPGLTNGFNQGKEMIPGEICAAIKRVAVRSSKYRHRPSTLPRGGLGGGHINGVNIRPFLPVNLDRYRERIDDLGNLGIFERFVSHHMAPMACRI